MWFRFVALHMLGISLSSIMCVRPVIITATLWLVSVVGQSPFVCVIEGIIITATFVPVLIAWLTY